jgi:hypothetical protein
MQWAMPCALDSFHETWHSRPEGSEMELFLSLEHTIRG